MNALKSVFNQGVRMPDIEDSRHWILMPLIFVLLAVTGIATTVLSIRASTAQDWLEHTFEVRQVGRDALSAVQEAEAIQRTYIITGDEKLIEQLPVAEASAREHIGKLVSLVTAIRRKYI